MGMAQHPQETPGVALSRPGEGRFRPAWRSAAAEMKSLNFWFLSVGVSILFGGLGAWLVPLYFTSKVASTILTLVPALGLLSLPIIILTVKLFTVRPATDRQPP